MFENGFYKTFGRFRYDHFRTLISTAIDEQFNSHWNADENWIWRLGCHKICNEFWKKNSTINLNRVSVIVQKSLFSGCSSSPSSQIRLLIKRAKTKKCSKRWDYVHNPLKAISFHHWYSFVINKVNTVTSSRSTSSKFNSNQRNYTRTCKSSTWAADFQVHVNIHQPPSDVYLGALPVGSAT